MIGWDDEVRRKRRIRMRFKACVRRVIENRFWLKDELTRTMSLNIYALEGTKGRLNFSTRVALIQKPENRTESDIDTIVYLLHQVEDFKRFDFDFEELAKLVQYQVVTKNRVVIREGHQALALFVILVGDVELTVKSKEQNSHFSETMRTQLHSGSMFGDYSLLYDQPRVATMNTLDTVELLIIPKEAFDLCMRDAFVSHYTAMMKALTNFEFFDQFDAPDVNEICFYGRVREYKEGDILYSSKFVRDMSFLIIEGSCELIELLRVTRNVNVIGKEVFSQYDPNAYTPRSSSNRPTSMAISCKILEKLKQKERQSIAQGHMAQYKAFSLQQWHNADATKSYSNCSIVNSKSQPSLLLTQSRSRKMQATSKENQRSSSLIRQAASRKYSPPSDGRSISESENSALFDTSKNDVVYEDTHLCRKLLRNAVAFDSDNMDPLTIDKLFMGLRPAPPYEPHFMKVATYSKKACFNIGENLSNRYIVAESDMVVLEIPKKVLARQKYVVWEQVRRTLDRFIPNSVSVFSKFIRERMNREWKLEMTTKLLTPQDLYRSGNRINHVPYSIRLRKDFDFSDAYRRLVLEQNKS